MGIDERFTQARLISCYCTVIPSSGEIVWEHNFWEKPPCLDNPIFIISKVKYLHIKLNNFIQISIIIPGDKRKTTVWIGPTASTTG